MQETTFSGAHCLCEISKQATIFWSLYWLELCLFGNGQKSIFVNGCLWLNIYYYISHSIFADETIKPSIL